MDFRSFMKNRKFSDSDKQKEADLKEKLKRYEGKSKGEIMSELMQAVEKSKRDGTLSISELERYYQAASPMLNDEQRKKMREIIDGISKD
jgi:flagellar motor component MotA